MCFLFFIIFIFSFTIIFIFSFTILISQYNYVIVEIYGDRMIQGYKNGMIYKDRIIVIALSITRSKRSEITNRYYGNATTINFKI